MKQSINNPLKIILIGPPGSGKGTQAEFLKTEFNLPHISSGDVLRSEVKRGSDFGKKIKSYMDKGEIGPVELITDVILNYIDENCSEKFLLDGFPRTLYQAEKLNQKSNIDSVFFISVSEQEIVDRITGRRTCKNCNAIYHIHNNPPKKENTCNTCGNELSQRSDDNEETVINRIKVYNNETKPVIEFYENAGLLYKIDGQRDPKKIFTEIAKVLS